MKQQILLTMVTCVLVTQLALADEGQQPWNRHKGYYAEANIGTNLVYLAGATSESDSLPANTGGWAWNVAGGYGFTPNHAIEGGFMQNWASVKHHDAEGWMHSNIYYLAWRGTVPIKDRYAFFGKAGGMVLTNPSAEGWGWVAVPFTGLGFSYAVTPMIDISVQYQGAVYVIAGAGELTVGVTYHF